VIALHATLAAAALLMALFGSPWLVLRLLRPRDDLVSSVALAGALSVGINTAIPVAMHLARVPITSASLLSVHAPIAILLILCACLRREALPPGDRTGAAPCIVMALALMVIVIPFTHLAGIDTYKWQGLATNVNVEQRIPWLVHPVSLLGFTPRSYPSAQPLMLATIQIMTGLGVDWGYYVMSVFSSLLGVFSAYALGRALFDVRANAAWFALLYAFSPVFARYNHWATGRGLFLALYPLFILGLLRAPRPTALLGALGAAVLLALSHKVGIVAGSLILVLTLASATVPRGHSVVPVVLMTLPFLALAIVFSAPVGAPPPVGLVIGFVRASITRFGWMIPIAALGLLGPRGWFTHPARRRVFPAMLATLPLAYPGDIYGAMLALPFVCVAATGGLAWLRDRLPRMRRGIAVAAVALTLLAMLTIVAQRSLAATPRRVFEAARFLERFDPLGPFTIEAPGRNRARFHAYLSGCPRFAITPPRETRVTFRRPPSLLGKPQEIAREWIDFGRNFVEVPDIAMDWYGINPRIYYVVIDDVGMKADTAVPIYEKDGVMILKPPTQVVPGS